MSDSVRPHRRQPTRLPYPWDSLGKNTGVRCHLLLQCMKVKNESELTQSCPTLSDPIDCSLWGSSVHGISQARVLEWGAIAFSVSLSSMYLWGTYYTPGLPDSGEMALNMSTKLLNLMEKTRIHQITMQIINYNYPYFLYFLFTSSHWVTCIQFSHLMYIQCQVSPYFYPMSLILKC